MQHAVNFRLMQVACSTVLQIRGYLQKCTHRLQLKIRQCEIFLEAKIVPG